MLQKTHDYISHARQLVFKVFLQNMNERISNKRGGRKLLFTEEGEDFMALSVEKSLLQVSAVSTPISMLRHRKLTREFID